MSFFFNSRTFQLRRQKMGWPIYIALVFTVSTGEFTFCGLEVSQNPQSILQFFIVEGIKAATFYAILKVYQVCAFLVHIQVSRIQIPCATIAHP